MFDALLGRKFYSKCKSNLKLIKIRMDKINKRRNSVQKFFRADIADLLKNNLDINAYGRAEGLLVEINMSSCYEMIEKFCECISTNLSNMDKQSDCPNECREAVPSLMYAAARFADLPELRELRNLFSTKYGNSLDNYISKEFVERLKLKSPTKEMKFQLLQEITDEASIGWDSKALEQRLYTPPAEHNRPKYGSFDEEGDTANFQRRKQLKDDSSNRKMEEEIIIDDPLTPSPREDQSEKKNVRHYGLVPPPTYHSKRAYASPAASSDGEICEGTIKDVINEKPKPKSVRRNRFNKTPSLDNEGSPIASTRSDPVTAGNGRVQDDEYAKKVTSLIPDNPKLNLPPPPYRRSYGDSSETGRSSLERERKHARGYSMPQDSTMSPRTMQGPTRAASFEPQGMNHIHPKLPDYDDLASRIASLTGR